jgi:hypothetical protein
MAPGLIGTAALAVVVSLAVHVVLNCPIQPVPSPPLPAARYPPNNLLQVQYLRYNSRAPRTFLPCHVA